jgi:hypothetical protein
MFRLIYFIPTYIIFLLFRTLMIAIGWIVVPPMAALHKYTTKTEISIINGREILNWKYKFMYLFGNDEDGLIGASEFKDKSIFVRIVYWCCRRNPANNMRFIPFISVKPNPSQIKFKLFGNILDFYSNKIELDARYQTLDEDIYRFITLTWQGIYSNLRCQFKAHVPETSYEVLFKLWFITIPKPHTIRIKIVPKIFRLWVGFKLYPEDQFGLSKTDYRRYGAGFATQLKRIYPRENK